MRIRQNIINAINAYNGKPTNVDEKALYEMSFSRDYNDPLGDVMLPRTNYDYQREVAPMLNSAVTACVHWFMRSFPEAPICVYNYNGEMTEKVKPHPATDLLRLPNQYYSGTTMMMSIIADYLVNGNAYIMKVRNLQNQVIQLWYTPAALIKPAYKKSDPTTFISHYEYRPIGSKIDVDPEDVIHLRWGLDPQNNREGLSPLKAVLREIFTDDEAANYSASLLKNMGVAGLFIVPRDGSAQISREAAEVMKDKFKERFTGDRRGEPFVSNMPLDIQNISFSPSEMNLRDVRTIPEERVCAALGVPAIVAGLGAGLSRSTFSNMSEAREMAYENGIIPVQRLIATDLTTQLLPEFETQASYEFGFENEHIRILQEDRTSEATRATTLYQGGVITRGEARLMTGFDAEEIDDIFRAPTNVNEVDRDERAPLAQAGGQPQLLSANPDEVKHTHNKDILFKEPEINRREFQGALEEDELELSSIFANSLQKEFDKQGADLADAYLTHLGNEAEVTGDKSIDYKDTFLSQDVGTLVNTILPLGIGGDRAMNERLELLYVNHYKRVAQKTFKHVAQRIGVSVVFNELDSIGQAVLSQGGTRKGLIDFSAQAKKTLFDVISKGREDGDNPKKIARQIKTMIPVGRFTGLAEREGVDAAKKYRSMLISRTETHNAQRVSTVSGYEQSGVVDTVRAIDAKYGDTDEVCEDRNGQEYTLEQARAETDLEHPNGTLDFEPIIRTPNEPNNILNRSIDRGNTTKMVHDKTED